MDKEYEKMHKILKREFGKNRKMYLATSFEQIPSVRIVNTYYWNESFYLVTHESSEIIQKMNKSKKVSLCTTASFHKFHGEIFNIGHPLNEENNEIRTVLAESMSDLYSKQHDESDPNMCLLQIKIYTAFTYANKIGYNVDFRANELNSFRFAPNA